MILLRLFRNCLPKRARLVKMLTVNCVALRAVDGLSAPAAKHPIMEPAGLLTGRSFVAATLGSDFALLLRGTGRREWKIGGERLVMGT